MTIKKVGVLGCGLMGSGIAQVSAVAGYDVVVLEQDQKFLDKGFAGIEKSLNKFAEKPDKSGITPEKAKESRARIKGATTQPLSPIATSSLKPSLRTWKRRRRCSARLTAL